MCRGARRAPLPVGAKGVCIWIGKARSAAGPPAPQTCGQPPAPMPTAPSYADAHALCTNRQRCPPCPPPQVPVLQRQGAPPVPLWKASCWRSSGPSWDHSGPTCTWQNMKCTPTINASSTCLAPPTLAARWAIALQDAGVTAIHYRPGARHTNVDGLPRLRVAGARLPAPSCNTPAGFRDAAAAPPVATHLVPALPPLHKYPSFSDYCSSAQHPGCATPQGCAVRGACAAKGPHRQGTWHWPGSSSKQARHEAAAAAEDGDDGGLKVAGLARRVRCAYSTSGVVLAEHAWWTAAGGTYNF